MFDGLLVMVEGVWWVERWILTSAPAEGNVSRSVAALLHQRFVELPPGAGVNARPAVLAVILQTCDVGTEKWSELATAASALTFIAHLIVQNVRLHLHLRREREREIMNTFYGPHICCVCV